MRHPYICVHVHLVWATWDRKPVIAPEIEERLYAVIKGRCEAWKCAPLAIGGTADHIHLLIRQASSVSLADLVGDIKGASSRFVNHEFVVEGGFKWQGAYGAFAVEESRLPRVIKYIERQKQHHAINLLSSQLEQVWTEEQE